MGSCQNGGGGVVKKNSIAKRNYNSINQNILNNIELDTKFNDMPEWPCNKYFK
jgi:hypothetical protein